MRSGWRFRRCWRQYVSVLCVLALLSTLFSGGVYALGETEEYDFKDHYYKLWGSIYVQPFVLEEGYSDGVLTVYNNTDKVLWETGDVLEVKMTGYLWYEYPLDDFHFDPYDYDSFQDYYGHLAGEEAGSFKVKAEQECCFKVDMGTGRPAGGYELSVYKDSELKGEAWFYITQQYSQEPGTVTIEGGIGTVTVTGATPQATLKLYQEENVCNTYTLPEGVDTYTFTGVSPGEGYHVTQTFMGEESQPSRTVTVLAELERVAPPVAIPSEGVFHSSRYIQIKTDTPLSTIWYTQDGSDPTDEDNPSRREVPIYAEALFLFLEKATTVKAYAVKEGMEDSETKVFTYEFKASNPAAEPSPGNVPAGTEVSLHTDTPGAEIWYTTHGGQPAPGEGILFNDDEPVIIDSDITIKAIAYNAQHHEGWDPSDISTFIYTTDTEEEEGYWSRWDTREISDTFKTWTVRFSKNPDENTISEKTVYVTDKEGNPVPVNYNLTGKELEINPQKEYKPGEKYTLFIEGLKSEEGIPLRVNVMMDFVITRSQEIEISEEYLQAHRLAANLLELTRLEEEMTPWKNARLGHKAVPFYRPDIEGIAYLEFPVFNEGKPAGYIMVSNGRHDHPVPRWNFQGLPLSTILQNQAREEGEEVSRLYKLDAMYYVAENPKGEKVASLGNPIVEIKGLTPEMVEKNEVNLYYTKYSLDTEGKDDREVEGFEQETVIEGREPEFEFVGFSWGAWREQKAQYEKAFKTQLQVLRESARENWEIEDLVAEFGEGLHKGDRYPVPALYPLLEEVSIPEEVKKYVSFNLEERKDAPPVLWMYVKDVPEKKEKNDTGIWPGDDCLVFDLNFKYANNLTETLRFALVDKRLVQDQDQENLKESQINLLSTSQWNPWNTFWAGTHSHQRMYYQFTHDYNGSYCPVGCGPVAWAMLFGWADNQADLNHPSWRYRWGIYRLNGRRSPAPDDVAPRDQHGGIENVIRELNHHMETFCFLGGGLTLPWKMPQASQYLEGRTFTTLQAEYSRFLTTWSSLRVKARDVIVNKRNPVVIGIGKAPAHYCLAYGYRWRSRTVRHYYFWEKTEYQREFYVNQGFGRTADGGCGWIAADTWFYGEINPF